MEYSFRGPGCGLIKKEDLLFIKAVLKNTPAYWYENGTGDGLISVLDGKNHLHFLNIEGYLDCSCGRPVPMKAKKNNDGQYVLEVVPT